MSKINKDTALQLYTTLKDSPTKYVTADILSRQSGVVTDIIQQVFSQFNPMVNFDLAFNLKDLLPELEESLNIKKTAAKIRAGRKIDVPYLDVNQFIYEKMTIGGIVDKSIELSVKDLRTLKKIVIQEISLRQKAKNKGK